MRRSVRASLIAAAITVVAIAVAGYFLIQPSEIPEVQRATSSEVFPELDFRAAAPGTSIDRIYGTFGKQPPDPRQSPPLRRCVVFVYDPDLFEGALVVLTSGEVVEERWIVENARKPEKCSGLPEEKVDLRGWHAAAIR